MRSELIIYSIQDTYQLMHKVNVINELVSCFNFFCASGLETREYFMLEVSTAAKN